MQSLHVLVMENGDVTYYTNTTMNVGQYPSVSSLDFMFHELVTDVMFVGGVMSTSNDGFRHHPVIPCYLPGIDTGYRICQC